MRERERESASAPFHPFCRKDGNNPTEALYKHPSWLTFTLLSLPVGRLVLVNVPRLDSTTLCVLIIVHNATKCHRVCVAFDDGGAGHRSIFTSRESAKAMETNSDHIWKTTTATITTTTTEPRKLCLDTGQLCLANEGIAFANISAAQLYRRSIRDEVQQSKEFTTR